MLKRVSIIIIAIVAGILFTSNSFLSTQEAYAYNKPWDQGHDSTEPEDPEDPEDPDDEDPCESSACPIFIANGNYTTTTTDIKINTRLGFDITRTYNSLDDKRTGLVGYGWVLNFESKLLRIAGENENYVVVLMANGQRLKFVENVDGTYETPPGRTLKLTRNSDDNEFVLQLNSDITFVYDEKLKKIRDSNGNELSLGYTEGCLSSIYDENGIVLSFTKGPNGKIASVSYPSGHSIFYKYDNSGNLISFTDLNGNTTIYEYDNNHNLIRIIDQTGGIVAQISYTSDGKVSSYTQRGETYYFTYVNSNTTQKSDSNGNIWVYVFDDNGLVTSVSDPLGNTTQRTFDDNKNLIRSVDANGNTTEYEYDGQGNVVTIIDALGNEKNMEYDNNGNLTQETNENGVVTRYEYDTNNNLITIRKAYGSTEEIVQRMEYDTLGNKTKFIDGEGNEFNYAYDSKGNLLTEIDPLGNVTSYIYDQFGNVISKTTPDGATQVYEYDKGGNQTKITDALGNEILKEYDVNSRLVKLIDEIGAETRFEYDTYGNQTKIIDPLGNETAKTYNSRHQVESLRDRNGNFAFFQYDAIGRLVRKVIKIGDTSSTPDGDDIITEYSYDNVGNVINEKDSYGNEKVKAYDALNRLTSETNPIGESKTYTYDNVGKIVNASLPTGLVFANVYNQHKQLVSISDSIGNIASFSYDKAGRRLSRTNSLENTMIFDYDASGKQLSTTQPSGAKTQYQYDSLGRILTKADGNGNATTYTYDAMGRIICMSESGRTFSAEYDSKGRKTSFTDANGNTTSYTYDINGNLLAETFADETTEQNSYDAEGRRISKTDRNGNLIQFEYHEIGALVKRDYPGTDDDMFQYDRNGRLIKAENSDSIITFTYDNAGRLVQETQNGVSIQYNYSNNSGNRQIVYPSGKLIREIRDDRYRLITLEDNTSQIVDYIFNDENRLTQKTYGNGIELDYVFNLDNKLTDIIYSDSLGENENFHYTYDNNGNRLSLRKFYDPLNSEQYQYDTCNRLIEFRRGELESDGTIPSPSKMINYYLDLMSNWDSVVNNTITSNRVHNSVNQITAIDGNTLQYDNNGNLIEDSQYIYEHNYKNLLTKVTQKSDGNVVVEYQYDPLGRRISKTVGSVVVTNFYYDSDRVIEERVNGVTTATYVFGIQKDEIIQMSKAGSTYYFLLDGLGSVSKIVDVNGNIVESYSYDPYGRIFMYDGAGNPLSDSAISNCYFFTGRKYEKEVGLYYYRARYYSPDLGRFLSRDPSGYADSMNLYEYVMSNPVIYIDPLGLTSKLKGCFTQSLDVEIGKKFVGKLPGKWKDKVNIKLAHTTEFCKICCGKETERPGDIVTDISLSGSATANFKIGPVPVPGWGVAVGDMYIGMVGFLTVQGGGSITAETQKCINNVKGSGCVIIGLGLRAEFGANFDVVAAYVVGGVSGKYKGCLVVTLVTIKLEHEFCASGEIDAVVKFLFWELKKRIYGIEKCWPLGSIPLI